jgi:hypothetical protein
MYENPDNTTKLRTILIQNVVLKTSENVDQDKASLGFLIKSLYESVKIGVVKSTT